MSDEMKIPPTPRAFWVEKINRAIEMMPELAERVCAETRRKGETKMETQFLARWHAGCANIKDGPFRYVSVAVSKLTQTATVTFIREPVAWRLHLCLRLERTSANIRKSATKFSLSFCSMVCSTIGAKNRFLTATPRVARNERLGKNLLHPEY